MASDELRQRLERLLDASGAEYRWLPKRGRHRSLLLASGDRARRIFMPNTPSDHRSVRNCVAMVKRALRGTP